MELLDFAPGFPDAGLHALYGRRCAGVWLDLLRAAIDHLRTALGHLLHFCDPHSRRVFHYGLDQHHRYGDEHARARYDLYEDAAEVDSDSASAISVAEDTVINAIEFLKASENDSNI